MSAKRRDLLDRVLRHDLTAFTQRCFQTVAPGSQFLPNWHIEAITYQLERIRRGEIRRLLITIPPRNLKSICASVAFPAFVLGHDPTRRIVCASYSQELAAKHARDCRAVMESAWYRELFPHTRLDPRKNTENEFETTARGLRLHHFHAWQRPVRLTERPVAFEPELNHLPVGDGLSIDKA